MAGNSNLNLSIRIGYDDSAVGQGAQRTEAQLRGLVGEVERIAREMTAARARTQTAASMIERMGTDATRAADQLSRMGAAGSRALRDMEETSRRTAVTTVNATGRISELGQAFRLAAGGIVAFQAAQAAINLGKTASQMQDVFTRLQGVTEATGSYAEAQQFLIQLSEKHHKTLSGLADGYTQILALEESGIVTRTEANRIMEGLSNAQSKYGTSNEQIKQSLYGLSQALSASTVQMDELRQVTDPVPGLLSKMEKAAGVAAGGFKNMAEKSELTRDVIKNSLIKVLGDLDGSAAKSAGTMTSAINDIQREWELLATAAEEPISFIVRVSADGAVETLKNLRQIVQNGLPEPLGSIGRTWARGGYLPGASNVPTDPLEAQFNDEKLGQIYQQDLSRRLSAAFPGLGAPANRADTSGFTGPAIPDDELKQRNKDADALQDQYKKLLEQSGNYRESLTLEATAKGLSEEASRTYVEQGLRLIEHHKTETTHRKAATSAVDTHREALQELVTEINSSRYAMESQIDAVLKTAEAEKRIELIRAGGDRSKQLEIEARYLENERVINQERLQAEIAYDTQLQSTADSRSAAAQTTETLARHQRELNQLNDDAVIALQRLNAEEQARGDAILKQIRTSSSDKEQLGILAQRLAQEGATADQIQRQLDLKQKLLQADRDTPGRTDIQAAIIQESASSEHYQQILEDTRQSAEQYAELWKAAARRVDDTFQQLWEDLISGQSSVGTSLKNMLSSSIAEIAHAAITRPFQQNLLNYLGAPTGATDTGSGIFGGLFDRVGNWLTGTTASPTSTAAISSTPAFSAVSIPSTTSSTLGSIGATASVGSTAATFAANGLSGLSGLSSTTATGLPAFSLAQQLGPLPYSPVTAMSPIANATVPAAAATTGSSFWSLGQSKFLEKIGVNLAGKMGLGAVGTSALGSGFANMGWGGIGSLIAGVAGIQGTNMIANLALPTFGGFAGGAAGGALAGPLLGAAAGPIGAIVGALIGAALSTLFNSTPKAEARYRYVGGSGAMQLTDSWSRNGGQLGTVKALGESLYTPLRQLERSLQVNLGQFDSAFYQRDKNMTIWGKDKTGLFFEEKLKFNESDIKSGIDRFMISIVKRESVLKQFDSALVQGAVRLSDSVSELQQNYDRAMRIRTFTGDITEMTGTTGKMEKRLYRYQDAVNETFASGSESDIANRNAELKKLIISTDQQFAGLARGLQQKLGDLTGVSTDAVDSLANLQSAIKTIQTQDQELKKFADKIGLFYEAIQPETLEAARKTAESALRDTLINNLKAAAGVADDTGNAIKGLSNQFKQFAVDAKTLGINVDAVGESLLGAFSALAEKIRAPLRSAKESLLLSISELNGTLPDAIKTAASTATQAVTQFFAAADAATKKDPKYQMDSARGLALIADAQTKILANYQEQRNAAAALGAATKQISEYSKNLIFSAVSTASPKTQMEEAKQQYNALISDIDSAKTDNQKTELLSQVTGRADQYLKSLLAYYGPTKAYSDEYNKIKIKLDDLGKTTPAALNYQAETLQTLQSLESPLNQLGTAAQAQIDLAAETVKQLGLLNTTQTTTLTALTKGETYNAVTGITTAVGKVTETLRASAKVAGLESAINTALTSSGKMDAEEASKIFNYIGTLKDLTLSDKTALTDLQAKLNAQAAAARVLGVTGQENRANILAAEIGNVIEKIKITPAIATPTSSATPASSATPTRNNRNPTQNSSLDTTIAANDSIYATLMIPVIDALSDTGELAKRLDTINAQFDSKAPLQTTLTGIETALSDKATLAGKLTNLNSKLDGDSKIVTTLGALQTALSDKGTLSRQLGTLNTVFDGKGTLQTTLTGIQAALGEDSPLAGKITNVNTKLTSLNKKTDDAETTRAAIKTGVEALPPLLTAISTGNQSAAATLAGGMAGFGKALTDGLSSLGSAIYSGMGQVGSAVGAKITDLNAALKTTQNQLSAANSALAQAQTALTQAQAAKTPVATTVAPKTTTIGPPTTIPARASGGPAQGWTLVGEQGPELVRFPVPVQVYSNDQSRSLLKESTSQDKTEIIASLRRLIELQAATIATLQQQGRNQSEQLDGLHREFARFSGKARLAA